MAKSAREFGASSEAVAQAKLKEYEPFEIQEQTVVFRWAALHEARCTRLKMLFAVPNGMRTSIGTAVKMKEAGMKAGVPDIVLPVPHWDKDRKVDRFGLWIEMKRRRSGRPSLDQLWWHEHLQVMGHEVAVCHGAQEAIDTICAYLAYYP